MGANWTEGIIGSFRQRKGYDISPWLPFVIGPERTATEPELRGPDPARPLRLERACRRDLPRQLHRGIHRVLSRSRTAEPLSGLWSAAAHGHGAGIHDSGHSREQQLAVFPRPDRPDGATTFHLEPETRLHDLEQVCLGRRTAAWKKDHFLRGDDQHQPRVPRHARHHQTGRRHELRHRHHPLGPARLQLRAARHPVSRLDPLRHLLQRAQQLVAVFPPLGRLQRAAVLRVPGNPAGRRGRDSRPHRRPVE